MNELSSPPTNFLGHSISEEPLKTEIKKEPSQKDTSQTTMLTIFIALLLITNVCSLSYIAILSSKPKAATSIEQMPTQRISTLEAQQPIEDKTNETAMMYENVVPTAQSIPSTDLKGLSKIDEEKLIKQVNDIKTTNPNLYEATIGVANDTKRRADLQKLSTTMRIYSMEKEGDIPPFPKSSTCIGSQKPCFDLFSILIPTYLDKPVLDPVIGNEANTGYSIQSIQNGIYSFILSAINEKGEPIEVAF